MFSKLIKTILALMTTRHITRPLYLCIFHKIIVFWSVCMEAQVQSSWLGLSFLECKLTPDVTSSPRQEHDLIPRATFKHVLGKDDRWGISGPEAMTQGKQESHSITMERTIEELDPSMGGVDFAVSRDQRLPRYRWRLDHSAGSGMFSRSLVQPRAIDGAQTCRKNR